jgi:hypothetical protein
MKTLWLKNQENLSDRISHAWAPSSTPGVILNYSWVILNYSRVILNYSRRILNYSRVILNYSSDPQLLRKELECLAAVKLCFRTREDADQRKRFLLKIIRK